jgi:hypothetical protein
MADMAGFPRRAGVLDGGRAALVGVLSASWRAFLAG